VLIIWIIWIVALSANSFLFALITGKNENPGYTLLSSLLFFYAQITGIFTIAGFLKILYPPVISLLVMLVCLALFVFMKKESLSDRLRRGLGIISFPPIYALPFCFVIAAYSLNIYYRLALPPLTTDGLLYHLPFAAEFFKTGSISPVPLYFTDVSMTYYPQGGSILYLFTLYSGKEFLFKLTQLPFALMGGAALYMLAKENGFSKILSLSLFCVFVSFRPVIKEAFLCYVDLSMAAYFLAALYFFSSGRKKDLPAGFVAAALLVTVKNYALIYLLPLIPFLFFRKKGLLPKKMVAFSIIFFLFAGCFTYLRNFFMTLNPFYPADVSFGRFTLFHGISTYQKTSFANGVKQVVNLFLDPISSADPKRYASLILFASLPVSMALSLAMKERKVFLMLAAIPASIILYIISIPPTYYQIRHLFPVYGMLSLSLAYPFRYMKKIEFVPLILCFLFLAENLILLHIIIKCFLLGALFFGFFFFPFKRGGRLMPFILPAAFLLLLSGWHFILTSDMYENIKYDSWKMFYGEKAELWEFVQKNSGDKKNIAYVGEFLLYPFYGQYYENNVFYQSVNSRDTMPVHKYRVEKRSFGPEEARSIYRKNPSYSLWRAGLKEKETDWIIVKKDTRYVEKEWIKKDPEEFRPLFTSEFADVYAFEAE